jgi:hypothetical protein
MTEWWKQKGDYMANPNYKSAKQLKQDNKFWARNDLMYLSDCNLDPNQVPQDDFKKNYVKRGKKNQVLQKVTAISHTRDPSSLKSEGGPGIKKKHNTKWTTFENQFNGKKNRLFDELPTAHPTREDVIPLFSSFNPGFVF